MDIPKVADWNTRYKLTSQGWSPSAKFARDKLTAKIQEYHTAFSPMSKRNIAVSILNEVADFEKIWKKDSVFSLPKDIADLRAAALEQSTIRDISSHKYDYACCIAYKVGTSKFDQNLWVRENVNGVQWYQGNLVQYDGLLEDEADRALRCSWMKAAINQAHSSYYAKYPYDPDDAKKLKVFMAPEFFFRGKNGAYDISFFSTILNDMRGLTKHANFKDWLFILGTVITCTFTGKISLFCRQCRQSVEWGNQAEMKSKGFTYLGLDAKGKQLFGCPGLPTSGSARKACGKGSVIEIADKAIIDNMALVQKGGEADDQNFHYVQKENVSAIDFRRHMVQAHFDRGLNVTGYSSLGLFEDDWRNPDARKIQVMGRVVTALPSPGAQDVDIPNFDQRPSDTGDERKSGGALFMIDGIKFGLEICVDHTNGRRLPPTEGVQIQLVPSAGAHIAHFVCRPGGIAFNVDGGAIGGTCNVLINTTGIPQSSSVPNHTSGGAPKDGQPGTEIILYHPSPIPWD